jgi:acetyl-CoA carboxylase carboxyl transferase subunit beta
MPAVEWQRCPACDAFVHHKLLKRRLHVCPECNHHFRLEMRARMSHILDEDSFGELSDGIEVVDVLSFVDSRSYVERIEEARKQSSTDAGAVYGVGAVGGRAVVLASLDLSFLGGSMGAAEGEVITRAAELALDRRIPLIVISASGGARVQEGCVSLMQMAKTTQAIARLAEAGVLYISLLTDPTYGVASASYAMLADVLIAELDAHIGFAGPNVIEQTTRQAPPDGFQSAESLLKHGQVDMVRSREAVRHTISRVLSFHAKEDGLPAGVAPDAQPAKGTLPVTDPDALRRRDPSEVVRLARDAERPHTLDYAALVFDDFMELHGDRLFEDDTAIVGGFARLGESTVMVIGHQKGKTSAEMRQRNFGMPNPEGHRKAARLMRHAARFDMPLVTFVDTPGPYPGIGAEERGQSLAIAHSILEMSRLPVPIVVVIAGEGGDGGALALAVGDRVLMLENSYYSVISPEGCAALLFRDTWAAPRAAAALRITAPDLLRLRVVDAVVREPDLGAQSAPAIAAANVKAAIVAAFDDLGGLTPEELRARRRARFRIYGTAMQPALAPVP